MMELNWGYLESIRPLQRIIAREKNDETMTMRVRSWKNKVFEIAKPIEMTNQGVLCILNWLFWIEMVNLVFQKAI